MHQLRTKSLCSKNKSSEILISHIMNHTSWWTEATSAQPWDGLDFLWGSIELRWRTTALEEWCLDGWYMLIINNSRLLSLFFFSAYPSLPSYSLAKASYVVYKRYPSLMRADAANATHHTTCIYGQHYLLFRLLLTKTNHGQRGY